ncbi:hypothetical protein Mboo_1017 [Methanoregula boonei 6A8]|uniref:Uncharacterized protein n=1 Tax=Methanoregula boonei (strain DSM 21154 / JCM 14090 / 6A8) TaxID=456442 RepID=A7I724_METB6|nr:hypothetical protein [Methanoregula boonei]ABS55535.1 hypothetical protein Mboo_1017 [Methanoregula boonei 6A8]
MSLQEKGSEIYTYWKDIILFFGGLALASIPIVVTLFPDTGAKDLPFSLMALVLLVLVTVFWPLAFLIWGFMSGFPFYGRAVPAGWYPGEPLQWAEIQMYYQRYRKYILGVIAVNMVFFFWLAGYILLNEGGNIHNMAEDTSGLILCSWLIMMGMLALFFCLIEGTHS